VFSGLIEDFKTRLDLTLHAMIAGAIMAFAGVAAFVCGLVVLFLWTMQTYGVMQAWGAIAAVLGVIAFIALLFLLSASRKRRRLALVEKAEREKKERAQPDWWQDPATLLTAFQVARTIGFKRMLPLLAIGAAAIGFLATREGATEEKPDLQPAE